MTEQLEAFAPDPDAVIHDLETVLLDLGSMRKRLTAEQVDRLIYLVGRLDATVDELVARHGRVVDGRE